MPNRKIKHIVAKLVGASTEETLDVYDVDAIHTDKIKNDLTTTNAGYVLDARQGKALSDVLEKFNFTTTGSTTDLTPSTSFAQSSGIVNNSTANVGTVAKGVSWAISSDKTVGKIYGNVSIQGLVGSGGRIWLYIGGGLSTYSTGSAYQISGSMYGTFKRSTDTYEVSISSPYLQIGATGGVTLSFICSNVASTYDVINLFLPASIYFFKNFGDIGG